MHRPRFRLSIRQVMVAVVIVGLSLGVADWVHMRVISGRYRRMAEAAERLENRCRKYDAMDAATKAREAETYLENRYLDDPDWNRRMIPFYEGIKRKYRHAAEHPSDSLPPDPPAP